MDVFDLSATLNLDTSEYEQGLSNAGAMAKSVGGKIAGGIKTAGVAIGALAAVGTAITGAFVGAAKSTADYGDKVDKMSQKIGISAEAYQKWDYVMQRAGGSVDSLKMGMKTLSQQAEKGNESFQKLGITQEDLKNLNQEELFEKTVKGLSEMEAGTERTALASELLGRAGADMGPLLNQGSEAIEEQMEIAEKYGMVMPDAAVKASAAFKDSLTTMSMTFDGLKNRMMAEFLPAMTQVTDGMAKLFAGDMSGADDVAEGIQGVIDKMGEVMPVIMEIGGRIIQKLGSAFMENLPNLLATTASMIASLAGAIIGNLPVILSAIASAIGTLGTQLLSGAEGAVGGLAEQIPVFFENVLNAVVTAVDTLADWLIKNGPTAFMGLAKGVIKAIPIIVAAAGKILTAIIRVLLSLGGKLLAAGFGAIKDFAKGILKGVGQAGKSALKVAAKVISSIGRGLASIGSTAWKAVTTFASKLASGVGTVASAAGRLASSALSAIRGGISGLGNIGMNIVRGIASGITNGVGYIKGVITRFVGNVKSFIKSLFGINSPSKWARDVIGAGIDEGVALGITQNTGLIDDAVDEMLPDIGEVTAGISTITHSGVQGAAGNTYNEINNVFNIDGAKDPEVYAHRFVRELEAEMRA